MTVRPASRGARIALWIAAIVLTLAAATYQRLTGPTYRLRGRVEVAGTSLGYSLLRSHETTEPATVTLDDPDGLLEGATLHHRRHPTDEPFAAVSMQRVAGTWSAALPLQPAAGKVAYYLEITSQGAHHRLPDGPDPVVLRYKGPVSTWVLLPHVLMMFLGMLFGVRAALSAAFDVATVKKWCFVAFACLTVGGLVLGPMVQKAAFGAYWTGWPLGEDLTDNKLLFTWIGWAIAAAALCRRETIKAWARVLVLAAAVIMLGVYVVPHSMWGSQLDYEKLDSGVDPVEAVDEGR